MQYLEPSNVPFVSIKIFLSMYYLFIKIYAHARLFQHNPHLNVCAAVSCDFGKKNKNKNRIYYHILRHRYKGLYSYTLCKMKYVVHTLIYIVNYYYKFKLIAINNM